MTRPTGTDAISVRHVSLDNCLSAEPSEYMTARMPPPDRPGQGKRSLAAGTVVSFAVRVVRVAEHADRVGRGLGAALHAQLGEQPGDVVLHGLLRQEQPPAHLPPGQPLPAQ